MCRQVDVKILSGMYAFVLRECVWIIAKKRHVVFMSCSILFKKEINPSNFRRLS